MHALCVRFGLRTLQVVIVSKPNPERSVNLIHAINQVLIQGESLNPSPPNPAPRPHGNPPHASNAIAIFSM